jgi:hypothetical protein
MLKPIQISGKEHSLLFLLDIIAEECKMGLILFLSILPLNTIIEADINRIGLAEDIIAIKPAC